MFITNNYLWFVLWGRKETALAMNIYKTSAGLKKWVTGEEWRNVPVVRLGKIEITDAGVLEKIFWLTRQEFLSQYQYL